MRELNFLLPFTHYLLSEGFPLPFGIWDIMLHYTYASLYICNDLFVLKGGERERVRRDNTTLHYTANFNRC